MDVETARARFVRGVKRWPWLRYRLVALRRVLYRIIFHFHWKKLERDYILSPGLKKLQVGSWTNLLDGWLNTDYYPRKNVPFLDVLKPLPFPDNSFDYVFSEHMVEHLPFDGTFCFFVECNRLLKKNGKIRIATPGLELLFKVFTEKNDATVKSFISANGRPPSQKLKKPLAAYAINRTFYGHGHKFIYDFKSLKASLEAAGFRNVVRCVPGKSKDKNLNNIDRREIEPRNRKGFNRLETIVVEATK